MSENFDSCMRPSIKTIFALLILISSQMLMPNIVEGQGGLVWGKIKKDIRNDFPKVQQMNVDSLYALMNRGDDFIILDARKQEEYDVSHIKDAVRIDPDIETSPEWLLDQSDKTVVVYCSVGYRSSKVADLFLNEGMDEVYNLEGSIFEWANKGYQVYSKEKRVHKVHPYNSLWGRLLDRQYRSQ